jgi:translation initiation factor IF-1
MANKDTYEIKGEITETLPNAMFRVLVTEGPTDIQGNTVLCTLAGKMKMYRIRVMLGDAVRVEMTKYDKTKGRITFRERAEQPAPEKTQ